MENESGSYQKGYQAGRRRGLQDAETSLRIVAKKERQQERIFMQTLEMVLKHCNNWTIGEKPINDAEGYCKIAKVFADKAIIMMHK